MRKDFLVNLCASLSPLRFNFPVAPFVISPRRSVSRSHCRPLTPSRSLASSRFCPKQTSLLVSHYASFTIFLQFITS